MMQQQFAIGQKPKTLSVSPLYIQYKNETKMQLWISRKTKITLDGKTTAHMMDGRQLVRKGKRWVYFPQ